MPTRATTKGRWGHLPAARLGAELRAQPTTGRWPGNNSNRPSGPVTTRTTPWPAAEGFIATVPGKGAYVLPQDSAPVREQLLRQVEDGLQTALDAAGRADLDREELIEILDELMRAEHQNA